MKIDTSTTLLAIVTSVIISVTATYMLLPKQQKIVTVDIKGLLQGFIVDAAQSKLEGDALSAHVSEYTLRLDNVTKELALQENLLLLPNNAVISGSVDITNQVKNLVNTGYGKEGNPHE